MVCRYLSEKFAFMETIDAAPVCIYWYDSKVPRYLQMFVYRIQVCSKKQKRDEEKYVFISV